MPFNSHSVLDQGNTRKLKTIPRVVNLREVI
jgi:hypothetical protein